MILESIVTTCDRDGHVNVAPMGPVVDGPGLRSFTLRPFEGSTTFKNLMETRQATIHVTDDVELFARTAIGHVEGDSITQSIQESGIVGFRRLVDCHRWFAVSIDEIRGEAPRFEMPCRIVAEGTVRPFFGFNRGKHAVIEASILATRIHLLDHVEIKRQMSDLQTLVEKTAGEEERRAFDLIDQHVQQRIGS